VTSTSDFQPAVGARLRITSLTIRSELSYGEPERRLRAEVERLFRSKAEWHRRHAAMPLREKVRILLQLQEQDLPLLARRRALRHWERPWPIEP